MSHNKRVIEDLLEREIAKGRQTAKQALCGAERMKRAHERTAEAGEDAARGHSKCRRLIEEWSAERTDTVATYEGEVASDGPEMPLDMRLKLRVADSAKMIQALQEMHDSDVRACRAWDAARKRQVECLVDVDENEKQLAVLDSVHGQQQRFIQELSSRMRWDFEKMEIAYRVEMEWQVAKLGVPPAPLDKESSQHPSRRRHNARLVMLYVRASRCLARAQGRLPHTEKLIVAAVTCPRIRAMLGATCKRLRAVCGGAGHKLRERVTCSHCTCTGRSVCCCCGQWTVHVQCGDRRFEPQEEYGAWRQNLLEEHSGDPMMADGANEFMVVPGSPSAY